MLGGSSTNYRGGRDVEGNISNTQVVKPLALSRQSIVIIVVVAIVFWASAFILWGQVEIDKWLLVSHDQLRTNDLLADAAHFASRYGMAIIVLAYLIYSLLAFKYESLRDGYHIILLVFLMFAVAAIGGDILKRIFDRARPFVEYAGQINALSNAATPAFPSGHASKSVALALPFLIFIAAKDTLRRGVKILLAVLALGVCYSRVVLGAHYVSDVLAGIGLALICLPLVTFLNNKMLSRMPEGRLKVAIKVWTVVLFALMLYLAVI